jgi:hypothetical protein
MMGIRIKGRERRHASIRRRTIFFSVLILTTVASLLGPEVDAPASLLATSRAAPETAPPCDRPGWFPEDFGLKDHTVFWHAGLYYIAAIYLAEEGREEQFAYGSSPDLCQWTDLGGILHERPAGEWDEFRIWAPYVFYEAGVYYLYYTGVTQAFAQSIMLATTANPADPGSWQRQGVVFQPSHEGSVWGGFDTWSDCRDPAVFKIGGLYHMYYTGLDLGGGIVGLATALGPAGPWTDWGPILTIPGAMPESPTLTHHAGLYYLFTTNSGGSMSGGVYHYGPTPAGPWSQAYQFRPGWAHELWTGQDGQDYASFLNSYAVNIRPLTWNEYHDPPRPFVGDTIHRLHVPLILQQVDGS